MNKEWLRVIWGEWRANWLKPLQHEVQLPEVPEEENERMNDQISNHNNRKNFKSQTPSSK